MTWHTLLPPPHLAYAKREWTELTHDESRPDVRIGTKPEGGKMREYQVVTLILDDGRKCSYTGRVQMDELSRVVGVEITPPRTLPDGMTWDFIPVFAEES